MASMVFASSPLSAQSLVKLRTNSKYPRSSCYVPSYSKANSYNAHLSYKISHIESSKSSFTTGDRFSKFPSLKFQRVASTLSPSLNIIKASWPSSIYDFNLEKFQKVTHKSEKFQKNQDSVVCIPAPLRDYEGRVLLIVNIPQQGSEWTNPQINYFNKLRQDILDEHKDGFEVLGFIYDKNELDETKEQRTEAQILEILDKVGFPIFKTDILNKEYDQLKINREDVWYFLRNTTEVEKMEDDFETFLVNQKGIPVLHFPRFPRFGYGMVSPPMQSGGRPSSESFDAIKTAIKEEIGQSGHQQS